MTPATVRRSRAYGRLYILIGLWYLLGGDDDPLTVGFTSWAIPIYLVGGLYLMVAGLASQIDPTKIIRRTQVAREGVHTTATILRSTEESTVNPPDEPWVQGEFTIDVDGTKTYLSDRTVMNRSQPARAGGSTVDDVVDRDDPTVFKVRWDTWREPPRTE